MNLLKKIVSYLFLLFLFVLSIYLFNFGFNNIINEKYFDAIVYFNIGIVSFMLSCIIMCNKENIESDNN